MAGVEQGPAAIVPAFNVLDVGEEGVALLAEPEWADGDRNSKTLFKADTLRVVLTALRDGAALQNEDPDEAVAVHVLQGELQVRIQSDASVARAGQLVCLPVGEPWQITASVDSLFLLILGRLPEPAAKSPGTPDPGGSR
jgi:quercetin dioxygenase-like cupin family protein